MVKPTSSVGSEPGISVGHIKVEDLSAWEKSTAPWDLVAEPLDGFMNFENHKFYIRTPSIVLYRECFITGLHLHGLSPPQMLALTIPLHPGPRTAYWKRQPARHEVLAALDGGLDVVVEAGDENLTLLVSLELLLRELPGDHLSNLLAFGANRTVRASPAIIRAFTVWQEQTLDAAMQQPDALRNSAVLCAIEQDLLRLLAELSATGPDLPVSNERRMGHRGLKKALEYIHCAPGEHVTIPELCAVACVSQRTLEYAFKDALGLSPRNYLRRRRLHAARRGLLDGIPGHDRVGDIAIQHGFLHLGRFSADYQTLFGELPSQTLACTGPLIDTPLVRAERVNR